MKNVKNLFLVDDDDIFVFLTKTTIERTGQVEQTTVFTNGQLALDSILKNKNNPELLPDVILLDLTMPILDGWQFLEEFDLIKNLISKTITIYILSSSMAPHDMERAKHLSSITDYLIKPVTADKLKHLLDKL
ncbi:MAG: response regulator [Bacteroidetes bacterium]|nr:response regulator [Bacteroidota bacterium]